MYLSNKSPLLVLSVFLWAPFLVSAQSGVFLSPEVHLIELEAKQTKGQNQLEGHVLARNLSSGLVGGIGLEFSLRPFREELGFERSVLQSPVASERHPQTFSLNPGTEKRVDFTFNFTGNLPTGDYLLRAQLLLPNNIRLGWKDIRVELKPELSGQGLFLELDEFGASLKQDGLSIPATQGHIIDLGRDLAASFEVKNPLENAVGAELRAILYYFTNHQKALRIDSLGEFTFAPGESRTIQVLLPVTSEPGAYHQHVAFYDGEERISKELDFMWSVGGEAAGVVDVRPDADAWRRGETARAFITLTGPPTGQTISDVLLVLDIKDGSGMLCGSWENELNLRALYSFEAEVGISKTCLNPQLSLVLSKNGKILDEYETSFESESDKALAIRDESGLRNLLILLGVLLVLGAAAAIFILKSRRTKSYET